MFDVNAAMSMELGEASSKYIAAEPDSDPHRDIQNKLILRVNREPQALQELLQKMGPHLTGSDDRSRERATLLLAEVLTRLPKLPMEADKYSHWTAFFTSRLSDFPSLAPALRALIALTTNQPVLAENTAEAVIKGIFAVHIPALAQPLRSNAYNLLVMLLPLMAKHEQGDAMEGVQEEGKSQLALPVGGGLSKWCWVVHGKRD
jgi:DNA repair/transcription protein MET18/MMS19